MAHEKIKELYKTYDNYLASYDYLTFPEWLDKQPEAPKPEFMSAEKIISIVKKSVNRHLVCHVPVGDDRRDRMEIMYEEISGAIDKLIIIEVERLNEEINHANDMIFAQRLEPNADVPFRVAYMRDLEKQLTQEKISYSRMIELLNEKAYHFYKSNIPTPDAPNQIHPENN